MPDIRQGVGAPDETRDSAPPKSSGPDPLIGRLISGRFRVLALVARGGMGKVYKAEQAPLGRICALKVLNPSYDGDSDPEFHKRFFLEASTAAKLTHPNTVTIFDYGKDEDVYFIAMEYIEGKTLYRVLRESGPLPEARAAHVARQICRSLREAHRMGVVHRDLKPANVLLVDHGDEKDTVKVLDFGLVKDVTGKKDEDLTQQGLFMGSPKYMSPEQITGTSVSAATDIYSLGVILYEMLSGKVPFDRGKSVATLMAHVNEPVPPMQSHHPSLAVSAPMDAIVMRCLAKHPDDRFGSMNDVLEALKRVSGGEWLTDTSEGLPAVSQPGNALPRVQPTGGAAESGPSEGLPRPVFVSPSVTDTLGPDGAARLDAGLPPVKARGRGAVLAVVLLGAVGAGIAAFVATRPGADAGAGISASTASPVASAAPSATEATAATAAADATRTVHVESDPPGASVSEDGAVLCAATPCDVTWKGEAAASRATRKLTLAKAGFASATLKLAPEEAKATATLDAAPAARPRTTPVVTPPTTKSTKPDDYKPSPY